MSSESTSAFLTNRRSREWLQCGALGPGTLMSAERRVLAQAAVPLPPHKRRMLAANRRSTFLIKAAASAPQHKLVVGGS